MSEAYVTLGRLSHVKMRHEQDAERVQALLDEQVNGGFASAMEKVRVEVSLPKIERAAPHTVVLCSFSNSVFVRFMLTTPVLHSSMSYSIYFVPVGNALGQIKREGSSTLRRSW